MNKRLLFLILLVGWLNGYSQKLTAVDSSHKFHIRIGGEARYQYLYIKNEGWGEAPEDRNGFVLARHLVHVDIHGGRHFRTFVQLQSSLTGSKKATTAIDNNALDLHQAFMDFTVNTDKKRRITFRLGRQELSYGSERLIAAREIPNNRQSFDAIKAIIISEKYQSDLFYSSYTESRKGIFDDRFNKNTKLWGAYIVRNNLPFFRNVDLYYIGLWKNHSVFVDGQGKEIRHSAGTRVWGKNKNWSYDVEGTHQFGKFSFKKISAWIISSGTSYKFYKARFTPEIRMEAALISGDNRVGDNRLQTFNPLFPKGAYFGLAALIGPSNLLVLNPSFLVRPTDKINLNFEYNAFWRYSKSDCIYGTNVQLIYSGIGKPSRQIGSQVMTSVDCIFNSFISFKAEFTWFNAGQYLKQAGTGKDILMTGVTIHSKF